ncbi:DASH family cryptochrome [Cladorrhinum samala]|uniref:Cryptochrome DASH n=1 Tax=Cladorrhinum samala TaxID=585594 RepID=A0AAV9HKN9_9PEZI|nr:DASH family cryptochrome [Cladorrhinum samala]
MAAKRVVIAIFRRDLRVSDNPLLHALATQADSAKPDYFLPLYVFQANHFEVSGFIKDGSPSPYKPARSQVGGYFRCGKYRAEFIAQAVLNLKESLESLGSGLAVRVGMIPEVVRNLAHGLAENGCKVEAVWMTSHEGSEEKTDEKNVESLCNDMGAEFKLWVDEKYFIDDRDTKLKDNLDDLPEIFTSYRKNQEPLRPKPRAVLPTPMKGDLPAFPEISAIPAQHAPFSIPEDPAALVEAVLQPIRDFLPNMPPFPEDSHSVHPFKGGEGPAHERLKYMIQSGIAGNYNKTRNGLLGVDFSTKLSAFLAQGCLTARQVHHAMVGFEDGTDVTFKDVEGYGQGENEGTKSIRYELFWRDYMRLCHKKNKDKLFRLQGPQNKYADAYANENANGNGHAIANGHVNVNGNANGTAQVNGNANGTVQVNGNGNSANGNGETENSKKKVEWKSPRKETALENQKPDCETIASFLERFKAGTTGMGFIDASQRELMRTGYTSNRARQNVASFLAKHLGIDWRYGAEWYEMLLVDYDVSSNWANWQYVAGVGNDPRGDFRIFNPVKQAFDYDKNGDYVRAWVPELRKLERLENLFQAWTASDEDKESAGLTDNIMATDPIHKIRFTVDVKPRSNRSFRGNRRARKSAGAVGNTSPQAPETNGHAESNGDGKLVNGASPRRYGDSLIVNGSQRAPGRGGFFGNGGRNDAIGTGRGFSGGGGYIYSPYQVGAQGQNGFHYGGRGQRGGGGRGSGYQRGGYRGRGDRGRGGHNYGDHQ